MKSPLSISFLLAGLLLALFFTKASTTQSQGGCSLVVSMVKERPMTEGGSWLSDEFGFKIFDITLKNNGDLPVVAVKLMLDLDNGQEQEVSQFWNLERDTSGLFNVPTPWGTLFPGDELRAGFIVRHRLAETTTGSAVQAVWQWAAKVTDAIHSLGIPFYGIGSLEGPSIREVVGKPTKVKRDEE